MSALERRVARWPEVIGDLLLKDLTEFPRQAVGDAIARDFDTELSWNWMDAGAFGFELRNPIPGWPEPDAIAFLERTGMAFHPLIRWFTTTGCPSPMTVARVPRQVAPERYVAVMRACMRPTDLDQQLSIPMSWHRTGTAPSSWPDPERTTPTRTSRWRGAFSRC